MLKLDPKAIEYFDSEFNELLLCLKIFRDTYKKSPLKGSFSEIFVKTIKPLSIKPIGLMDGLGNTIARVFECTDKKMGLFEKDYEKFSNVVDKLYEKREINRHLSKEYVEETIFKAFQLKYTGALEVKDSFVQYLLSDSNKYIKPTKIAIPISYMHIEEPFQLGDIKYEYFTKEYFNQLERENCENIETINKYRDEFRGVVIAIKTVIAEEERAAEIVIDEVTIHLKLLRCFCQSAGIPEITPYFDIKGLKNIPILNYFILNDNWPVLVSSGNPQDPYFNFNKDFLNIYKETGFYQYFDLVTKENKSEFEETLLDVAMLFSRCVEVSEFQDRIVYALVSLETLLLKNSNEPIISSLSVRFAFLVGKDVSERKQVIELIKKCYAMRSAYIHHGKKRLDFDLLRSLQNKILTLLIILVNQRNNYKTKAELISYLEERSLQ